MNKPRTLLVSILMLVLPALQCSASTVDSLVTRQERFGRAIPQEKVYVHMDNTCYWLGDTIWFAAYTRQTNDGRPSNISRILYVELYNQDGYLMERQLIEMKDGRGHGNIVLKPTFYYGGYYELRAYTRWHWSFSVTGPRVFSFMASVRVFQVPMSFHSPL